MNRNMLKIIAVIAMTLDHLAVAFLQSHTQAYFLCRLLGRIAAPVMCFFISEGYFYTSDRKKYAIRLLIFALLSQYPFMLLFNINILNVLFSLLAGYLIIWLSEKERESNRYVIIQIVLFIFACFADWSIIAVLFIINFNNNRFMKKKRDIKYIIIGMFNCYLCYMSNEEEYLYNLGFLLFLPLIKFYNPKKENKKIKFSFYVYYPLHMYLIYIIKQFL